MGEVIVITSGKGGVGKTTTIGKLAAQLKSQQQQRILELVCLQQEKKFL